MDIFSSEEGSDPACDGFSSTNWLDLRWMISISLANGIMPAPHFRRESWDDYGESFARVTGDERVGRCSIIMEHPGYVRIECREWEIVIHFLDEFPAVMGLRAGVGLFGFWEELKGTEDRKIMKCTDVLRQFELSLHQFEATNCSNMTTSFQKSWTMKRSNEISLNWVSHPNSHSKEFLRRSRHIRSSTSRWKIQKITRFTIGNQGWMHHKDDRILIPFHSTSFHLLSKVLFHVRFLNR
jgi:hypothetical protein